MGADHSKESLRLARKTATEVRGGDPQPDAVAHHPRDFVRVVATDAETAAEGLLALDGKYFDAAYTDRVISSTILCTRRLVRSRTPNCIETIKSNADANPNLWPFLSLAFCMRAVALRCASTNRRGCL